MGLLEKVKGLFKKPKLETEEYQQFKACKETNFVDIQRFKKYIAQYSVQAEELKEKNDDAYKNTLVDIKHYQYALYEVERAACFIRPNNKEDVEYRNNLLNNFSDKVKEMMPENLDLRFHGTPIYFAKEILSSKKISSSADRFDGYIKSTDSRGEISVSDINSLSRTINWFLDVTAHQRCLPCGCLFVLTSVGQTEDQKVRSVMHSVDFSREPERLFAIVTTPENIQNVKGWLTKSGLSSDLVCSFDDFVVKMEKLRSNQVNSKDSLDVKMAHASIMCSSFGSKKQIHDIIR